MRILVLSQYYDPEPLPRPVEIAEELTARGHDVGVLTGLPNYPSGTLAPGYRMGLYQRERIRGIPVDRVLEIPYHGPSARRRLLNYGSFALSAALAGIARRRPDVVFVCHPPLTIALAAWAIKTFRCAPFIYDVQDIWPDAILMSGMLREGRAADILRTMELFAYRHADRIVVVTEGARRNLMAKGVDQDKIVVLPPWPYGESGAPVAESQLAAARAELGGSGKFVVTFVGNVGLVQGLETAVRAAALLDGRPDIQFRIVGDGVERARLEELSVSFGLTNIRFLGQRPIADVPALQAASDALLVHLVSGPLTDLYLPAKTLSYLAAGRPIVMAMTGEAAELVRSCEAGVVVTPEDPEALAHAIVQLTEMPQAVRERMGLRGRECAATKFSRRAVIDRVEELLREAVSRRSSVAAP